MANSKRTYQIRKTVKYVDDASSMMEAPLDTTIIVPQDEEIKTAEAENLLTNNDILPQNLTFEIEDQLVIPDRWIIKAPEDPELPFLLNFYKGKKIITTFPLTEDNLSTLMPILDSFHTKEVEDISFLDRITRWVKGHKVSAGILVVFILIIIIGLGLSATTALGAG